MCDSDEDAPHLSAATFSALQEFYKEQEDKEQKILSQTEETSSNDIFQENWQLSQFWYDDTTIETLVKIAIKSVGAGGKVALISCPTLFKKLKTDISTDCVVTLFEYDPRFICYGSDFILYDYKNPLNIPRDKAGYYDLVIADPPFLSEECLTKTAVTMKYLTKNNLILCTGAVMSDLAKRLLYLLPSKFKPKHKNNLANEFNCFSNYNVDDFL